MWSDKEIRKAAEVDNFLKNLSQKFPKRWNAVRPATIPFGSMAYAQALVDWERQGCPSGASFSYPKGEIEDPYLMEFREELYQRFGIRIFTREEAKEKIKQSLVKRVYDWGPN